MAGLAVGAFALTRHEDDKKIVDLGKIEIKQDNKAPSSNTTIYYVLAAALIVGGAFMTSKKS